MKRIISLVAAAAISTCLGQTSRLGAAPIVKGQNYIDSVFWSCASPNCEATLTAIPPARFLVVTHLSCQAQTKNAANIPRIFLSQVGSNHGVYVVPTFMGNRTVGSDVLREYVSNDQLFYVVIGSGVPRVFMKTFAESGVIMGLNCSIGGLLKPN